LNRELGGLRGFRRRELIGLAGALGLAALSLSVVPVELPQEPWRRLATGFLVSPFERQGGKVIYVTGAKSQAPSGSGGDIFAMALPDAVPFGALAQIPLRPQGRSLLWSADEILSRAPSQRRLFRAKTSAFPPEAVESISRASNSLGVMAPGILVARPNSVSNHRLDTHGYSQFADRERNRRAVLFSAGSDGLVHAFDAGSDEVSDPGSGAEIFAYAPRGIVSPAGLDGALSFDDVYLNAPWAGGGGPCRDGAVRESEHCQWRTVVAGGLGGGGRSVFALDVTRPDADSGPGPKRSRLSECAPTLGKTLSAGCAGPYPSVLWEFEDDGDADRNGALDLASTTSTPSFGRVRLRNAQTRRIEEHSILIFGGGHEPDGAVHGPRGDLNRSGNWLYVLDVESGSTLYKSNFGAVRTDGSSALARRPFGAIASAVSALDLDQDGYTDTIYFGDLKGQLWKLVIPESDESVAEYDPSPRIARNANRIRRIGPEMTKHQGQGSWCPVLLFDGVSKGAEPAADDLRIFHPPAVVRAGRTPQGELIYGIIWGTGSLEGWVPGSTAGRVVVVWDVPDVDPVPRDTSPFLIPSPTAPESGTCRDRGLPRTRGWSLKLLSGEGIAADVLAFDGYVYVVTRTREGKAGRGGSRLYRLDLETGDSCHGADCCAGSTGAWTAGGDRGRAITSNPFSIVTAPKTFVASDGARQVGLVRSESRSPDGDVGSPLPLSLVTFRFPSPVVVRSRREP
jgi:hypothetical protein